MKIHAILHAIEKRITSKEEHYYFLIHEARYQYILEQIQKLVAGKKLHILDVGCYPYHMGAALEQLGHIVLGISSPHEPIKNKKVAILNIEKDRFPYKDNTFDLVLCSEVLEHLPQSPVLALVEMRRVTKPSGYLLVTTPNIARSINRAKLLIGKSIMYPVDELFKDNNKGSNLYHRHNREYTLLELCKVFRAASWFIAKKGYFISYTPKRRRPIPDPWWLKLGKYANYFLMCLVPELSDTLLIVGKI